MVKVLNREVIRRIDRGSNGGGISGGTETGITLNDVWGALAGETDEQINLSHLTSVQTWADDRYLKLTGGTINGNLNVTGTLSVASKMVATQEWVGQNYISIAFFDRLFKAYNGNTQINANDTTSTIDNIKAMFGFWTEQYLSALGKGDDQGGGGGQGDVTWALLADDTDIRPIALSHLTNALSGYATQSWVNTQLGSYATQSWVTSQGYITSSALTGLVSQVNVGSAIYTPVNGVISLPAYPSAVSQLTNDTGFITSSALNGYATESWVGIQISDMATKTWVNTQISDMATKTWLGNNYVSIAFFDRLFKAYNGNTQVSPNDTTSTIDNIKAMFGFWTEQYLSALGRGSDSGGGGGQGDVTWALLADDTDIRPIALSHLTNALSGYATQSWVNTQLGSYATQSWVTSQGYITSSALTGLVSQVNVGTTAYTPVSGVVSLPAYPTTLPASDVYSWAKASTKPSYSFSEITGVASTSQIPDLSGTYLPLTGGILTKNSTANIVLTVRNNASVTGWVTPLYLSTPNMAANSASTLFIGKAESTNNTGYIGFRYIGDRSTSNQIIFGFHGNDNLMNLDGQGNLGIGTTSPTYRLHVNGNFRSGYVAIENSNEINSYYSSGRLWLNGGAYTTSSGVVIPSGNTLTIGDAVISWDSTAQGIKITKGLYSETFISALGAGTDQGGGGDVTWALLADNTDTRQIAMSHLTNVLSTLTGYTTSGKNYAVQKDSSNHLYVYVPWDSGSGGATSLSALTDVNLTSLANNQFLKYNSTSSKWENTAIKTINGQSLIGSGDISVGGGASGNYLPLTGGTLTNTSGSNVVLTLRNTGYSGTGFYTPQLMLVPNLGTNGTLTVSLGRAESANNFGYFGFVYKGSNSVLNHITFGFHSSDHLMNLTAQGRLGIGTQTPTDKLEVVGGIVATKADSALKLVSTTASQYILLNTTQSGTLANRADIGYSENFVYISNNVASGARIGVTDAGVPQYWTNSTASPTKYNLIHAGNISTQSVASAAKLTTARSLWGNSFDGTADISGTINSTATYIITNSLGHHLLEQVNTTNDKYYSVGWGAAYTDGWYAIYAGNYIRFSTGATGNLTTRMMIESGGNVGIATTTPNYKLHVNGTFNATTIYQNGVALGARAFDNTNYLPLTGGTISRASNTGNDLKINNTGYNGTGFYTPLNILVPNIGVNGIVTLTFGKEETSKNFGYIGFAYKGNSSDTNHITFGFHSSDNKMTIDTQGNVGVTGTINTSATDIIHNVNNHHILEQQSTGGYISLGWGAMYNDSWYTIIAGKYIQFSVNAGTEAMRIISSGNVGIGTSSPSYKLHVNGTFYANRIYTAEASNNYYDGINFKRSDNKWDSLNSNGNGDFHIYKDNGSAWAGLNCGMIWIYGPTTATMTTATTNPKVVFAERTNGTNKQRVGIVYTDYDAYRAGKGLKVMDMDGEDPNVWFEVAGNFLATGAVTALSDIRHKDIIKDVDVSVEQIARMPAVVYKWNDRKDKDMHVGSIAQDWQRILPEVVMRDGNKEGTLSMQYGVAALVSSIITARTVVDHERRIAELERENQRLKQMLNVA